MRQSLMAKLGYADDVKLLIVHADDLAVTHSVNDATIRALETGLVNSGSVMVTCSWLPEIVDYARSNPDADLGLHLTLTSERLSCRWGPVCSKDKVPSLLDKDGYFHRSWTAEMHIDVNEAEIEVRAQIEKALALGMRPSHLDSHQFQLYRNRGLFSMLVRLGFEYEMPVVVSRDWFGRRPYLPGALGSNEILIDHQMDIRPEVPADRWPEFYARAISNLHSGISQMNIHLGFDDEEMQAFSRDRQEWGAAWRQRDFDFFTGREFAELLERHSIRLVTWRELGTVVNHSRPAP